MAAWPLYNPSGPFVNMCNCRSVGISLRTYYTLKEQGDAPAVTVIGGRNVIRHTTAAAWLEAHEDQAA